MNKISPKKANRGDVKQSHVANPVKSKSNESRHQIHVTSNEYIKKSNMKSLHKNEDNLHQTNQKNNKKLEEHPKKSRSKDKADVERSKQPIQTDYGDGKSLKEQGKIHKYIFHDDDTVSLKYLNYSLDLKAGILTLYDPKKSVNKRSYFILSSKEICYDHIKEHEAFQLKVKKIDKDMISDLVLKAASTNDKYYWLEHFGIKMHITCELLNTCIQEVENRRFCKGQKKRNETKELKDVDIGTLLRALEGQAAHKVKLTNDKRWNVSRIEKLIQVLLNETPQPLIPYQLQEILEKSNPKTLQKDYTKLLKHLPMESHKMLQMLIDHLENLTNYYSNQLNANSLETEKIRRNICSRLTPLIIRQDVNKDPEVMDAHVNSFDDNSSIGKFCSMFYKLMESSNSKKTSH